MQRAQDPRYIPQDPIFTPEREAKLSEKIEFVKLGVHQISNIFESKTQDAQEQETFFSVVENLLLNIASILSLVRPQTYVDVCTSMLQKAFDAIEASETISQKEGWIQGAGFKSIAWPSNYGLGTDACLNSECIIRAAFANPLRN